MIWQCAERELLCKRSCEPCKYGRSRDWIAHAASERLGAVLRGIVDKDKIAEASEDGARGYSDIRMTCRSVLQEQALEL